MTKEDDKYRQGRSKQQYNASAKILGFSIIGIITIIIFLVISSRW